VTESNHPAQPTDSLAKTYLISAQQAHRIEQVATAMRLSESAVLSLVLTGWERSGQFAAWLAESDK
jgi:hypothetical protein